MPMLRMKKYCENVKNDAYGGSIELVEDGITAIENELEARKPDDVMGEVEGYVDSILEVTSPILPLINMLNKCMIFMESYRGEGVKPDVLREKFITFLETVREEQRQCVDKIGKIGSRMIDEGNKVLLFLLVDL